MPEFKMNDQWDEREYRIKAIGGVQALVGIDLKELTGDKELVYGYLTPELVEIIDIDLTDKVIKVDGREFPFQVHRDGGTTQWCVDDMQVVNIPVLVRDEVRVHA